MNWDAIGAIGQAISVLAFVLAIIQIRHLRSDTRRAIGQERTDRNVQVNLAVATNERLASLRLKVNEVLLAGELPRHPFIKAATEQLGVTGAEAFMLYSEQMARWGGLAQTLSYLEALTPGDRARFDRLNLVAMTEPLFQFWYGHMKPNLNPDAVQYFVSLMSLAGRSTPRAPARTE